MSLPDITTREQWLIARKELLIREKELTRQRDALNADRRRLPMVRDRQGLHVRGARRDGGPGRRCSPAGAS